MTAKNQWKDLVKYYMDTQDSVPAGFERRRLYYLKHNYDILNRHTGVEISCIEQRFSTTKPLSLLTFF